MKKQAVKRISRREAPHLPLEVESLNHDRVLHDLALAHVVSVCAECVAEVRAFAEGKRLLLDAAGIARLEASVLELRKTMCATFL